MDKTINFLLQLTFGLIFIISASLKIAPIEPVELYIYSFGLLNWEITTYATRLLIGAEFALGLLLMSGIHKRTTTLVALGVIGILSLFLIYTAVTTDSTNCFCFGSALPMTPLQSIVKNILLFGLGVVLLNKPPRFSFPKPNLILVGLVGLCLALPFIINIPDPWMDKKNESVVGQQFPFEKLPAQFRTDLKSGKHIICFFSLSCKYCHMSAQKISAINKRLGGALPIQYFFFGPEDKLDYFWEQSNSEKLPYEFLPTSNFFKIVGQSIPVIYCIDNGTIIEKTGYRDLMEENIITFISNRE